MAPHSNLSAESLPALDLGGNGDLNPRGKRPRSAPAGRSVETPDGEPSGGNLLQTLFELVREIAEVAGWAREYEAFRRYHGLDGSHRYTLQKIGLYFGVTRERARQLRNRMRESLEQALAGTLTLDGLEVPAWVPAEGAALRELLAAGKWIRAEGEIAEVLGNRWGNPLDAEARAGLPLLLELLGARGFRGGDLGLSEQERYWTFRPDLHPEDVAEIATGILQHLREHLEGRSWFELTVELNRRSWEHVPPERIRNVVDLMEEVETAGGDRVRLRLEALPSHAERACRVLAEEGNPLHFQEIARRINRRYGQAGLNPPVRQVRVMAGALSRDDRLEPIARTGIWKLRAWSHVRPEPLLGLAVDALRRTAEPMSHDELHKTLAPRRPGISRSMIASLPRLYPERVVRVGKGMIALSDWGIDPVTPEERLSPREVHGAVREVLLEIVEERDTRELALAEVVREMVERRSLVERTVRAKLAREPWAELRRRDGQLLVRVDVEGLRSHRVWTRSGPTPKGVTVSDRVGALIRECLDAQPGKRAPVRELRQLVRQRERVKDPTIYWVLNQVPGVQKVWEDGVLMAELHPPGPGPLPSAEDGGEGGALAAEPMRPYRAYCSARDRKVHLIRRSDVFEMPEEGSGPLRADVVCLDFGPACTGAQCPLFDVPSGEMGRRLAETGIVEDEGD